MSFLVGHSVAQSPIVFTTVETNQIQSNLVRFDTGVESFAVTAPGNPGFLGTTIHNGSVLVADYVNERIQRFSPTGTVLAPFADFSDPTFLESDNAENVYTTHSAIGPNVGTRFNSAGAVTQSFSHDDIAMMMGIDADAAGNVYIVNRDDSVDSSSLFKFTSGGVFVNETPLGAILGSDISIDEVGQRLMLAVEAGATPGVSIYDISGAAPTFLSSITAPTSATIVGVHYAAESGNILATDFGLPSNDPRGIEYSPTGVLLREYRAMDSELNWDITTFQIPEPSSAGLAVVALASVLLTPRRRAVRVAV